jgi:hypothetical protein
MDWQNLINRIEGGKKTLLEHAPKKNNKLQINKLEIAKRMRSKIIYLLLYVRKNPILLFEQSFIKYIS